jgi:tetratricopeptide (TPR) repeat protein
MANSKEITKIAELLGAEEHEFKEFLYDSLFAANIKPSPLKSLEASKAEAMQQIDKLLELFKTDVKKGFEIFEQKALPIEQERLAEVFNHLNSIVSTVVGKDIHNVKEEQTEEEAAQAQKVADANLEFLESIASRVYGAKDYEEASCMFRFIIQLDPLYSPAWVEWALCEQAQDHDEVVDQIFEMGINFLPHDYLIRIYASEYYIKTNRKDKAREILEIAKTELVEAREQESHTFKKIQQLLTMV